MSESEKPEISSHHQTESKMYLYMNNESNNPNNTSMQCKKEYSNPFDRSEQNIEALLLPDSEIDDELDQNYELTMSDLEREMDAEEKSLNNKKTKTETDFSKYPCNFCAKIYDNFPELREHKKAHFIEKRTCTICGIVCRSLGKLEQHKNSHLGLKPCVCDQCGKSYGTTTQLRIHKRIHTDEKRYKCEQCNQAFRYNGTLKSHIRLSHTNIMETTCKICSKYCTSKLELKKHTLTVHVKQPYTISCQLCKKVFKSEKRLSCHLKVHTELKFPCEFCQRIYPSLYRLKKHVGRAHIPNICECKKVFHDRSEFTKHNKEFHKTQEPTVCNYCDKEFDKPKNLTEHIRLQHKGNGKVNKCGICEKEFINASLLRNHVKTHEKNFKCEYCGKIFGSRYNLQIHTIVHTKEKNHKCEICGNMYGTKIGLKNHQYVHSEERNFTCKICGKSFKSNHRLYSHKFTHETERKFECEICQSKFTTKQYLNFHMNKHSDKKPFECKPCQKRFKHKRSFERHCLLRRHELALSKYCEYCDIKLDTGDSLNEHISEAHSNNEAVNEQSPKKIIDDFDEGSTEYKICEVNIKTEIKVEPLD
ncbi:hypothetical protein WA026_001781 [Henosepilachna vigintioctopunctata]|uniref:C2H2-type domain-containing protein n=1 Tax=Henosepilachna vigintioctopunctata TaxID=420089 RepID=A0AAW1UUT8_9CUCU